LSVIVAETDVVLVSASSAGNVTVVVGSVVVNVSIAETVRRSFERLVEGVRLVHPEHLLWSGGVYVVIGVVQVQVQTLAWAWN